MKGFHGIDLVVTRASGVIFEYEDNLLKNSSHINTPPLVFEVESGAPSDLALIASLRRTEAELSISHRILEESPGFLFIDGSICPHPSLRPAKTCYRKDYRKIIRMYDELIRKGKGQGTMIVGIVEDSRSTYFSNLLQTVILPGLSPETRQQFSKHLTFRDTALLYDALAPRQKTFTFKMDAVPDVRYGKETYAFYLKTAKYDRPVRVEFVSGNPQDDGVRIARSVVGLSAFSDYGIPSVIIEADARAKLTGYYMEYIERLLGKTTPLMMKLRREGRPI